MARKPALSIDSLKELGTEKLATLILDEAERSASFRKLVAAALAGAKGPEAFGKLIDRPLGGLEEARDFIDWDRAGVEAHSLAVPVRRFRLTRQQPIESHN